MLRRHQTKIARTRKGGKVASYFVILTQHCLLHHARREGARRDPEVHQFARMCAAGGPAAGATPPPRMARLRPASHARAQRNTHGNTTRSCNGLEPLGGSKVIW